MSDFGVYGTALATLGMLNSVVYLMHHKAGWHFEQGYLVGTLYIMTCWFPDL